jgi:tRNA-Thr(GGU) m(6)t(6)A37 methyltransferase TsaA
MEIKYIPIGFIHSPFNDLAGMPIQPGGAIGIPGQIHLDPQYTPGLKDLDGFSHVLLIYHLHLVEEANLIVTPFLDTTPRGVFSTRAPKRPNPIGLSVVKLVRVEGHILHIENVDILDGTPLLDIKPYAPQFDGVDRVRTGWLEASKGNVQRKRSDDRFR